MVVRPEQASGHRRETLHGEESIVSSLIPLLGQAGKHPERMTLIGSHSWFSEATPEMENYSALGKDNSVSFQETIINPSYAVPNKVSDN